MKGVNHVVITGNVGSRFEDVDLTGRDRRFTFDVCCDRRDDKVWMTVNVYQSSAIDFMRDLYRSGQLAQGSYVLVEGSIMRWKRANAVRAENVIVLPSKK